MNKIWFGKTSMEVFVIEHPNVMKT